MNHCATTVLSLWISTMPLPISSLNGLLFPIPAVVATHSLRFHAPVFCLLTAVVGFVAAGLPTKLTGISFPSVPVSLILMMSLSVLCVLIYLLMMTKIIQLTAAGVPPFFLLLYSDVREI
jgi:hypothetical protein